MIAWTIDAARKSDLFDRVVVSTDSPEIAAVARECGVEVPFLRSKNADDHAPVSSATIAALIQAGSEWKEEYEIVCQLMPNCPLRTATHIRDAYDNFVRAESDFQISCFKFGWMNPWWAVRLSREGVPERLFPEAGLKRSQDLEDLYCPTGAIWLARVPALMTAGTLIGPGHRFFPIDWKAAVDIDDQDDIEMAEAVHKLSTRS
jgi:N-acylneuraminate cytidylyltransferase